MPELPEVEVIKRGLQKHLPGRRVDDIFSSSKKLRQPMPEKMLQEFIKGAEIKDVNRRAKYLVITMDSGAALIVHLGMSGRLGLFANGSPGIKHDHFSLQFDNEMQLRFNDVRRFGSIQVLAPGVSLDDQIQGLGPEPLGPDFTAVNLYKISRDRTQPVKNFLMDSRVVVGIGNIYASETLFKALVRPATPAGRLGMKRWQRVVDAAREVLQHAIDSGGTTISDFVNESGKSGYFQLELQAYGRAGKPCRKCGKPIIRKTMAGRSTFFCPKCQK